MLGILYFALAIWLFFNPLASYFALSVMFSAFMFVSGVSEIVFAVANRSSMPAWGWYLAGGILDLIIGILLLASPGLSMAILPYILAFWLLFRGIAGIGHAVDLRRYGSRNWGWYLFLAILAVACSIGIIFVPMAGAMTFVLITGYTLLVLGFFRLIVAFELRRLKKSR